MVMISDNSIAKMLYNDLSNIYHKQGSIYFKDTLTKEKSVKYYNLLKTNIIDNNDISTIVKNSMSESLDIWLRNNTKEYTDK